MTELSSSALLVCITVPASIATNTAILSVSLPLPLLTLYLRTALSTQSSTTFPPSVVKKYACCSLSVQTPNVISSCGLSPNRAQLSSAPASQSYALSFASSLASGAGSRPELKGPTLPSPGESGQYAQISYPIVPRFSKSMFHDLLPLFNPVETKKERRKRKKEKRIDKPKTSHRRVEANPLTPALFFRGFSPGWKPPKNEATHSASSMRPITTTAGQIRVDHHVALEYEMQSLPERDLDGEGGLLTPLAVVDKGPREPPLLNLHMHPTYPSPFATPSSNP